MKKAGERKYSISAIVVGGCVLLGLLITVCSCFVGYTRYTEVLEKSYNDKAYNIAYTAIEQFDGETVKGWLAEIYEAGTDESALAEVKGRIEADETYQKYLSVITVLRDNMEANYIYLADMMGNDGKVISTLTYVMDADNPDDAYPPFVPGETGPMNKEFLSDAQMIYETGERSSNYFYSHSAFGYNTSAIAGIRDSEGKVIAILGVELTMSTLQAARTNYIISTALVSLVITAAFVAILVFIIRKTVLKPIDVIVSETEAFVSNEAQVSEKLGKIESKTEIGTLSNAILQMETNIQNYITNITKITAEKERIGAELDVAAHIQASMLPCIFPAFPDRKELDIYATMNPAKEVGGDFYDFFMVDNSHLAIVMADVSGKGVPAALFMVIGKTLIKDHTVPGADLGEVFSEVNELLCQSNSEGLFITAFEGVLDLVTGEFTFVNAGHEMPFIYRKGGGFEPYKIRPGFVLAGMEGMRFRSGRITLDVGDKIFQYTDGVTEATNAQNELFGMDRLTETLNRVKESTPEEILPAVKADIDRFVGEAPQFDDITMLCLEYKEKMKAED